MNAWIGRKLAGRYRLLRELGRGGLGVVFLARDARRVEARDPYPYVALKGLHERLRDDEVARGVLCEQALYARRIASRYVVRVHDLDRDGDDPFMTMEYVRGTDLRRAMRGGVSREQAWAWIDGMGRALADMHSGGWIHADFKPANVMVDARGGIRLLDVGSVDASALTPAYSSRSRREGAVPSARDDVYAFACVAYELLSGRRPCVDGGLVRLAGVRGKAWRVLRDALEAGVEDIDVLWRALRS